jgi:hypothetical protein
VRFPLKIGLLADSQITSQNGFSDFNYRSKAADELADVAIRPPALECVLAEGMLKVALRRLTEDSGGDRGGVDVILYLGAPSASTGTGRELPPSSSSGITTTSEPATSTPPGSGTRCSTGRVNRRITF